MITINVTKDCIAEGRRLNCRSCPIAVAMKRAGFLDVHAAFDRISWRNGHKDTGHKIQRFIDAFDRGVKLDPFSFKIAC